MHADAVKRHGSRTVIPRLAGTGTTRKVRRDYIGFVFQSYICSRRSRPSTTSGLPSISAAKTRNNRRKRPRRFWRSLGSSTRRVVSARAERRRAATCRHRARDRWRSIVILADEPTAALDAENGRAVMAVLARVAKDPARGVLVVTHTRASRSLPIGLSASRTDASSAIAARSVRKIAQASLGTMAMSNEKLILLAAFGVFGLAAVFAPCFYQPCPGTCACPWCAPDTKTWQAVVPAVSNHGRSRSGSGSPVPGRSPRFW